jgi:hypothetical protein
MLPISPLQWHLIAACISHSSVLRLAKVGLLGASGLNISQTSSAPQALFGVSGQRGMSS